MPRARLAPAADGPAADVACSLINFFTDQTNAANWTGSRPDITGTILRQQQALQTAAQTFGTLLSDPSRQ
jgi:hypothetical protein